MSKLPYWTFKKSSSQLRGSLQKTEFSEPGGSGHEAAGESKDLKECFYYL